MDSAPVFLHVTDTHLRDNSTYDPNRSDLKVHLQGMSETSRESLFSSTLKALAEKLKAEGIALDGVIFSGDGNLGADTSGMLVLKTMLLDHLSGVGVCAENIVAVPGNHDVKKNTFPGSKERYENFVNTWRAGGIKAKTPFLFDIDEDDEGQDFSENILRSNAGHWAVLPMNSSNWSHSKRDDMSSEFIEKMDKLIGRAARKDRKALTESFNKLFEYDAAFISGEQLDKARDILQRTDPENSFRIVVLHHHLLPVNRRVEAKPYGDLIDLGAFRQFIRENKIRVIIHGHKHSTAAFYDHIYDDRNNAGQPHRVLILSGGTFGDGTGNDDPFRLIEFENLQFAPKCKITPVPLVQPGGGLSLADPLAFSLWETERCETTPILVQGSDINTVYNRACQVAKNEVATRPMLICKLDIDGKEGVDLFPDDYPEDDHVNCKAWFESIVRWWQLPHSRIEKRIPYIHGARLNRYGGNIDQLSRIARLLKD